MILYENTIANFREAMSGVQLIRFLQEEYESGTGKKLPAAERQHWKYVLLQVYIRLERNHANPACGIRIDYVVNSIYGNLVFLLASQKEGRTGVIALDMLPFTEVKASPKEDMIVCREPIADAVIEIVHPVYHVISYSVMLLGGVEYPDIDWYPVAAMFEMPVETNDGTLQSYGSEINRHVGILYANDNRCLQSKRYVFRGGSGREALARVKEAGNVDVLGKIRLYDDQKIIIEDIKQSLAENKNVWYLIKNPAATGGSLVVSEALRAAEGEGKEIVVLDRSFEPEDVVKYFRAEGIGIWLHDEFVSPEALTEIRKRGKENGVEVKTFSLHENVGTRDNGGGLNWLIRHLQLGNAKKKEWNPETYSIEIVSSTDEFRDADKKNGIADVVVPAEIAWNEETRTVSGSKKAKQELLQDLSRGRRGVRLYIADEKLCKELQRQWKLSVDKFNWIRDFCTKYAYNPEKLTEAQSGILQNETVHQKYEAFAREKLGEGAWEKMDEESRLYIISGLLAYNDMKKYNQLLDFSGVCIQICKAVELEIGRRFYTEYRKYLEKRFGAEVIEKAPYGMLSGGKRGKNFLEGYQISLGGYDEITGMTPQGKIQNKYSWQLFAEYCQEVLLLPGKNPKKTIAEHLQYIDKIRLDYRNDAAHKEIVDVSKAKDCIDYVAVVFRKLGVMLDDYTH